MREEDNCICFSLLLWYWRCRKLATETMLITAAHASLADLPPGYYLGAGEVFFFKWTFQINLWWLDSSSTRGSLNASFKRVLHWLSQVPVFYVSPCLQESQLRIRELHLWKLDSKPQKFKPGYEKCLCLGYPLVKSLHKTVEFYVPLFIKLRF